MKFLKEKIIFNHNNQRQKNRLSIAKQYEVFVIILIMVAYCINVQILTNNVNNKPPTNISFSYFCQTEISKQQTPPMEIIKTKIKDLFIIKPDVFEDERGYFFESFSKEKFMNLGLDLNFVQDNESKSQKSVLRGLHFQKPPFAQGKLVRVVKGAVLDVAVDLRANSDTYGQWEAVELSEENKLMYWVPPGFAHGFLTLRDETVFTYKCTNVYNKESEGSLLWNDSTLNIDWGYLDNLILSEKDLNAPLFEQFDTPF